MAKRSDQIADRRRVGGIILAGGASSRLGRDKAFIKAEGMTLIERVVQRLQSVVEEIVLVTDDTPRFSFLGLPMVNDTFAGVGTLGGLHAGLATLQAEYGVAVGCDMPFLNPDLLRYLISLRSGYDAVMPMLGRYYEPLHAVYGKRCLVAIEETIEAGQRRIMHACSSAHVRYVEDTQMVPYDPGLLSFFNVNEPQDLERMHALLRSEAAGTQP
jgi:molybdopterin-guanine dinucleotide biosynthesis protein A